MLSILEVPKGIEPAFVDVFKEVPFCVVRETLTTRFLMSNPTDPVLLNRNGNHIDTLVFDIVMLNGPVLEFEPPPPMNDWNWVMMFDPKK